MRTIYKYQIPVTDDVYKLELPEESDIVKTGRQWDGHITIWVDVETTREPVPREFRTVGTGQSIPLHAEYIGTAFDRNFVWHLYEV